MAGASLRQVSLETQHAFGAVGYSEEHEAPRHFRQVHLAVSRCGSVPRRYRGRDVIWWLASVIA